MTLWRRPAQLLPVQVRPVGGETVVSYVFRLADANGFARPTMLLRAIGEPVAKNVHAGILDHHDITLNAPALARLAALTGRATASLGKTLPSLGTACADRRLSSTTQPLINAFSSAAIRGHCQQCIARIPGHPNIRVDGRSAPAICRRHHRWVDTTGQHPNQVDLCHNIEIITAHRRFQRLPSTIDDPTWARQQLCRTTGIVTQWHHRRDRHSFSQSIFEQLHARWDTRAQTLPSPGSATPLLVMPEAVALAEILCDPQWRRHVAIADHYDLMLFYGRSHDASDTHRNSATASPTPTGLTPSKAGLSSTANSSAPSATSSGDAVPTTLQSTVSRGHPPNKPPLSVRHEGQ